MGKKSKKKTKQGASSTLDTVETATNDKPAIDDDENKSIAVEPPVEDLLSNDSVTSVNLTGLLQAEAAVADAEAEAAGAAARAAKAQVDAAAAEEPPNDSPSQSNGSTVDVQTNPLGSENPPPSISAPTVAVEASKPLDQIEANLTTPAGAAEEVPPLIATVHTFEPASVSLASTPAPASKADPEVARKAKLLAEQAARRAQYEAARAEAMEVLNGYNGPTPMSNTSLADKPSDVGAAQDSASSAVQPPSASSVVQDQSVSAKPADRAVDAETAQVAAQAKQLTEDLDLANNEDEDEEVREEDLDDVDLGSFDRKSSFRQNGSASFNEGGSKPPISMEKSKRADKPKNAEADNDEDEGGDSMGVACDVKRACAVS